jgi:hypothetical protein
MSAQEGSATSSSNPLHQAGILQCVLEYVGAGHWCFVAEVSNLWKVVYEKLASTEVQVIFGLHTITCVPQTTTFSAVFGSRSRVRLAHAHGPDCATKGYQRAAGMYADVATLKAARELGMRYTPETMKGAVRCNQLAVVQFLHAEACPWDAVAFSIAATRGHTDMCAYMHAEGCPWSGAACYQTAMNGHGSTLRWLHEHGCPCMLDVIYLPAAQGGSVDAMKFLQQQGIVYTAVMLREMLNVAGAYSKLAAAKWLRAQGAEWPQVLEYGQPWTGDTLLWARAEGCTSPTQWG